MGGIPQFFGAWRFDPFIAANLIAVLAWYLWAVSRVNRTGRRWPWWQTFCFATGIALLAAITLGPMGAWSHTFFWVHMTGHLVVMMVAAPLLVLGGPVTLTFRASSSHTRRRWILPMLRSRAVRILTDPVLTWVLFAVTLLATHFTPFYEWALANHDAAMFVEQPLFLIVALLYYFPLLGTNLQPRRPSAAIRLASLASMMIPEAIVGAVIYFAPAPLYPTFAQGRPFGPSPLEDQQLAGALMWALVMVVDAFWMMIVAAEWYASEEKRAKRVDAEISAEQAALQ